MTNQTIHKLKKRGITGFTVVPNSSLELITDPIAVAVWLYLLSKPEHWTVRETDVCRRFGFGRKVYQRIMRELKALGLVWKTTTRDKTGKIAEHLMHVSAEPEMLAEEPTGSKSDPMDTRGSLSDPVAKPPGGKMTHLVNKDSLENKDSYKCESDALRHKKPKPNLPTRARTLSDDLNDRSWAGGFVCQN